jgi:hypothetical protein
MSKAANSKGGKAGANGHGQRQHHVPKLKNMTHSEAQAIAHMFTLYDYKSTGRIPPHLAVKLISMLGFEHNQYQDLVFSTDGATLGEVLMNVDQLMPPQEPMLNSSLTTFVGLVSRPGPKLNDEPTKVILPEDISNYVESLGRPPAATKEVVSLLSSMQEYDDCSVDAMLRTELFTKEILLFQKKNNALKDFR